METDIKKDQLAITETCQEKCEWNDLLFAQISLIGSSKTHETDTEECGGFWLAVSFWSEKDSKNTYKHQSQQQLWMPKYSS